jgi:fibronectin-binding autotransporter adhesin
MGASTLTLTQASTFTGGATVGGGALEVSADAQLGAAGASGLAPVTVARDYGPAGSTSYPAVLRVTGSYATNRPVIAGDGTIENAQDVTMGAVTGSGLLVKDGAGKLTVPSIVGGGLSVGDGTLELAAGGGTSKLSSFGYALGKLDVTNNKIVFSGPAASSVRGWLQAGGVVSATAQADGTGTTGVGYLTVGTTELDVTTWGGLPVSAGDVVTKLTYTGDINLDGKVNADDFALMDRGLAKGLAAGSAAWVDGDVNYDGIVDAGDFLLADKAYARNGGVLSPEFLAERDARFGDAYVSQLVAAVPEPAVGGLVAAAGAAMSLGGRRRRRTK